MPAAAQLAKVTKAPKGAASGGLNVIVIPRLKLGRLILWAVGVSPWIMNKWSFKVIRQMLTKHMGEADAPREDKDPVANFVGAMHLLTPADIEMNKGRGTIADYEARWLREHKEIEARMLAELHGAGATMETINEGKHDAIFKRYRYAVPTAVFLEGMATCALDVPGIRFKSLIYRALRVEGFQTEMECGMPRMREDVTRNSGASRSPDVRHRPAFFPWRAKVAILYREDMMSPERIVNLGQMAGFSCGGGDWRQEKGGHHGAYEIETAR